METTALYLWMVLITPIQTLFYASPIIDNAAIIIIIIMEIGTVPAVNLYIMGDIL